MSAAGGVLQMLLDQAPVLRAVLSLLVTSTVTLSLGLVAASFPGRGPAWRALALRSLTIIALVAVAGDLIVQREWAAYQSHPLPVTILTTAPAAATIDAMIHPSSIPVQPDKIPASDYGFSGSANGVEPMRGAISFGPGHSVLNRVCQSTLDDIALLIDRSRLVNQAFLMLWAAIAVLIAVRQIVGRLRIRLMERRSSPVVHSGILALYVDLCGRIGFPDQTGGRPRLVVSAEIDGPFVAGLSDYTIFLPDQAVMDGDSPEVAGMLAHELAHARSRDPLFQLLLRLLCAVCWFQPLAWLLARSFEGAAEEAADASVVSLRACEPAAYARLLCGIAERRIQPLTESIAGIGMLPNRSMLSSRIRKIVSGSGLIHRPVTSAQRITLQVFFLIVLAFVFGVCIIRFVPASPTAFAIDSSLFGLGKGVDQWRPDQSYIDQFHLTAGNSWSIAPVTYLPSETGGKNAAETPKNLPVAANDRALIARLTGLGSIWYGPTGPPLSRVALVERLAAEHPHQFYAEYLLSVWYAERGQTRLSSFWQERSLLDAPAVLAGRVQFQDGTPVAGIVETVTTGYGQGQLLFHSPQEQLRSVMIYQAFTDDNGCFYLPVYGGVLQLVDSGQLDEVRFPSPSATKASAMRIVQPDAPPAAFRLTTRVGLLPPYIARPYIALSLNGVQMGAPSLAIVGNKPAVLHGADLRADWQDYPGVDHYSLMVYRVFAKPHSCMYVPVLNYGSSEEPAGDIKSTSILLNIRNCPGLRGGAEYAFELNGLDRRDKLVAAARPALFTLPEAPRSVPVDPADFEAVAGPGVVVRSITSGRSSLTVSYTRPAYGIWNNTWMDTGLFGVSNVFGRPCTVTNERQVGDRMLCQAVFNMRR